MTDELVGTRTITTGEIVLAMFNANILVRELRKASGLTQEQVAEGICSRQTISAIEKGKRKPDWYTFSNIMRKLNIDPALYYSDIASEDEVYIINQANAGNKLISVFDYEGIRLEVEKMEQDARFAEGLGYQVLLSMKTILYSQGLHMNTELAYKYAMEYIRLFRPDFEVEKIPSYHLSYDNINAINRLCTVYQHSGEHEKAIEIYYTLIDNFERVYQADIGDILWRMRLRACSESSQWNKNIV